MSPRRSPEFLAAALCACGLLAAGNAWALQSDKNQPININSDHAEFKSDPKHPSNGVGTYTGHVVITQGSIQIEGDRAVFHLVNNDLDTAEIYGDPVTFTQKP
ncbi:MAG TPA: LptA/OstA family protein, partial [Gammaproteobacteria bacterium]